MLNSKLIILIEEYNPLKREVDGEMLIYHDLNIYGDDADELLNKYSKMFNVSLRNFKFSDYFPSEGYLISQIFTGWLKRRKQFKYLRVIDLNEAIEKGELM